MKEIEEKSKNESIFKEWADVTTAHGFMDFSRANTVIGKVIWFILIFFCLTLMIYQLYRVTDDYAKHEWITTVKENASDSGGLKIPTIIICNINRLKWSKAQEFNMTLEMIGFLFYQITVTNVLVNNDSYSEYAEQYTEWRLANNFSYFDVMDNLGPTYEDIVLNTYIEDANITIDTIYTIEYGRCPRLVVNYTSEYVGSQGGIQLLLDVQGWDYIPLLSNNYASQGLVLQLSYNGNAEMGQWIKLQPGTQTSVALQPVESTVRLQDRSIFNPFNYMDSMPPCTLAPKLRFLSSSEYQYSSVNCKLECYLDVFIGGCGCLPMLRSERIQACAVEEILPCSTTLVSYNLNLTKDERERAEKRRTEEIAQCPKNCSQPCYERYVDTQVSLTKFPSINQQEHIQIFLERNFSNVHIEDIILLEIYYSSMTTKLTERYEAISLEDLISNSGGLIGVWAGMSFLTICQAIGFFIKYLEERKQWKSLKKGSHSGENIQTKIHSLDLDISAPYIRRRSNVPMPGYIYD